MNISESKKSIELYGEKGLYASIAYVMCEAEGKNPLFVNHTGVENLSEYLRIAKVAVDCLISSGLLSLDKPGDLDEAQDIWQRLQILGFSEGDRKRLMGILINHASAFGPSGLDNLETWVKESMKRTGPSEEVVTELLQAAMPAIREQIAGEVLKMADGVDQGQLQARGYVPDQVNIYVGGIRAAADFIQEGVSWS